MTAQPSTNKEIKNRKTMRGTLYLSNCDSREKFIQLLVVPDGELEMARDDPGLLVVPSSVAGQLQHLQREPLMLSQTLGTDIR